MSARYSRSRARGAVPTRSTRSTRRTTTRIRVAQPGRLVAGGVAMACAVALLWISLDTVPAIDRVEVVGARHVRVGQAISQSGLVDLPSFSASAAQARDRLRTLPAVRDARVELLLPTAARITLVEREAIGRWVASDGLEWFVDVEGFIFPSNDGTAAPGLRVADERAPKSAGERLDPALVQVALRLAAVASGEFRADATSPRTVMTAGASGLVLRFGSGWEIRFGGPESFDEKLALARKYLRDNPTRRLDYVDVRNADRIVVSPLS